MGLLSKRTRTKRTSKRALRKAHTKTLKAQAQAERKFREKAEKKAAKDLRKRKNKAKATGKATVAASVARTQLPAETTSGKGKKADTKADKKAQKKNAEKAAAQEKGLNPKKVRNALGIMRVLAPVLAPLAYKAATATRGQLDQARARKMGVSVHELGDFSGHGAALNARIAGLEPTLDQLASANGTGAHSDAVAFREATRARLGELSTAVHAAERMPAARRKAAHRAVATELDAIEADLLARLGVR
ncbi:DUF6474 family protein [Rhodococcus sp. X156]|uniref:DUF6474 family protein n=1 Tax=Rhodococcus sp. X156 TaxID=2499145 RepID=UPI000FD99DEB|nr:DUF6474 family protein [Rhodococcus sp. X156]